MASAVVPSIVHESQATARARVVSAIQRQGALIALVALIIFGVVRYGRVSTASTTSSTRS